MIKKTSKPFPIAAVFFGGVIVTLVVVAVVWVGTPQQFSIPESASASVAPNSPGQTVGRCTGPVSNDVRRVQKVTFADPRHVDAAEAFPAVLEVAKTFSPDVGLLGISANFAAQDGKFDLSENPLIFMFEYRCTLPNLPPEKELRAGQLTLTVSPNTIRAEHLPSPPSSAPRGLSKPPLHMPPCPSSAAFALAVATGIPSNAAATFVYTRSGALFPGGAWHITGGGHGEFRREVEGKSCARIAENDQELKGISAPPLPSLPKAELSPEPPKVTHAPAPPRDEPPRRHPMEGVEIEHADVADLLPHAKKLALQVNSAAVLVGISAQRLERGLANLSERNIVSGVRATFSFEYRQEDREQDSETPAEGGIVVIAERAHWEVSQTVGIATLLRESGFPKGGLDDTPCRSKDAWTAAGETGIADRLWYGLGEGKHAAKAVWRWDRGSRSIFVDGKTCRMVAP